MSRYILLTEFFPPHHGGIEDSLERLLPVLGHDVTVVTPASIDSDAFDQRQPQTIIRRSLFSGRWQPRWLWLVPWLWSRRKVDLVIFGHFSAAVFAAWFLRPWGLRYAICVHGNDLLSEAGRSGRHWFIRRQLKAAEWIGTNSTFTADLIHGQGVPRSRIVKLFPMVRDEAVRQAQNKNDQRRLITICRLVKRKNVEAVIRAVAELVKDFPDLHYDIVGDGPERHRLHGLIIQLGLTQTFTLQGHVSDQKKWEVLKQSSLAVMTPLADGAEVEGLGLFYLEASACGLPIVASQGGGVSEAVIHDQTGVLVPPEDHHALVGAIRRLLLDQQLGQRLGQAGRQYIASEFTSSVRLDRFSRLVHRQHQINPPFVSVVIPAYQSASTIANTINDLLAQTWPNIEIIVVDDGSTDDITSALGPFSHKIKLLHQPNQGAAVARNTGAAQASGYFLLFVDADTRLDEDLITTMAVTLQTHPEDSFVYCNFQFGPKGFRLFEFDSDRLKQRNYIHTTSLIKRADFPGFDASLKKFQDWDLWLTMVERRHRGVWLPRQLFRVEQRKGGMSTWLPRFVYRLPMIGQGKGSETILKYRQAESVIRAKHHLK